MTYKEALEKGKDILNQSNIQDASNDAWELFSLVTHLNRTDYFLKNREKMDGDAFCQYSKLIRKRAEHIPLQHITGKAYFYGYEFKVNENVLIPRFDTEVLVENVLKLDSTKADKPRILDVCTGSGCIILSLAKQIGNGYFVGSDISSAALEVAMSNKELLKCDNVEFIENNLLAGMEDKLLNKAQKDNADTTFDIIVSNPPYIPTADIDSLSEEVKNHDPMLALDGMEDGLYFYRKLTEQSVRFLKEGGNLCYEIGYNQGSAVSDILKKYGYDDVRVIKDLAGLDRVVIGTR